MQSGALQQKAWELAARARVQNVPRLVPAALRAAGLQPQDERGIAAVLDAYNHANPVNILALRCVALHMAGGLHSGAATHAAAWQPPVEAKPLPPIINPQDMPQPVRELAMLLTDRGPSASPSTLWPSLYRHLAHWPAFLGYASVLVVPRFAEIDAAAATLRAQVEETARELAPRMTPPAEIEKPAAAQRERLQAAITQFTGRIPEMAVIGNLLQDALP
jgi:hypothetical protein